MQWLDTLQYDARQAWRGLRREPALVGGIIATLALALGANASMFGLVGQLMLSAPEGVAHPERVVQVNRHVTTDDGEQYTLSSTSYPAFLAMRRETRAFAAVAAVVPATMTVGRGADLTEVASVQASGDYFRVLDAHPERGRFFASEDDELPLGRTVVVLSHAYWKKQFGGDPAIVGRELILDGDTYTIIGVAAPGFNGDHTTPTDVFVPLTSALRNRGVGWWSDSRINLVSLVARLRDGISVRSATLAATTTANAARIAEGNADDRSSHDLVLESLVPGQASRQAASARIALWLAAVSVVVLLIATANVGTLLLLRALRRRRETAIRMALGVRRRRLAQLLIMESLLLATIGGAAGLVLSQWFSSAVRVLLLPTVASSAHFVDRRVLLTTACIVVTVALLAGLVPILQLFRTNVTSDLRTATGQSSPRQLLLQRVLVGSQVALCTLLLVGAGLFVQSLERVRSQDLGFSTSHLLYATIDFRAPLAPDQKDATYVEAVRRLTALSGVSGASVLQASPFGPFHVPPISAPGYPDVPKAGDQPPLMYGATPEYLRLMGVKLLEGRLIAAGDVRNAPLVVLVNQSMARLLWPGASALGQCIRVGFDPHASGPPSMLAPATLPCRQVVGVVADTRARSLKADGHETHLLQYYVPFEQLPAMPFGNSSDVFGLLVQTTRDPDTMVAAVQRAIQGSATSPVLARVRPYQDLLDPQLRPWRLGASLFSAFGALALCMAIVGLYAVVAYTAAQRTREIGVRLALGGTSVMMQRLVVSNALRLVSIGVAAGVCAAFVCAPFIQDLLFDTSPRSATALSVAALTLLAATLAASLLPAWRAGRVTPMEALRME